MSRVTGAFVMGHTMLAVLVNGLVYIGNFLNYTDPVGWRAGVFGGSALIFTLTFPIACLVSLVGGVMLLAGSSSLGSTVAAGGLMGNLVASVALLTAIEVINGLTLEFALPVVVVIISGYALYKMLAAE